MAIPLPDSLTFEQFDRGKRCLFALRSGLRCYRRESWEGVCSYRQVVEADDRDVAGDRKPSFAQGRSCSNRNRVVAGEQCGWTMRSTQDFVHRVIAAFHTEIARGDQCFVKAYPAPSSARR
jgi:hypothetical protein